MKPINYILFLFILLTSCGVSKKSVVLNEKIKDTISTNEVAIEVIKDSIYFDYNKKESDTAYMTGYKDPKNDYKKIKSERDKFIKSIKIDKELPVVEPVVDNKYVEGLIAIKVPKDMIVGENYLVKIRITKEKNKTILIVGDRNIPISDDDNSLVNIEKISISPIMSAKLLGGRDSFIIDTLSTEYQNISKQGYTEWTWSLIPIKSGENLLKLNVRIRVKEDGETYYKDIVVYDKKIKVKSNLKFSIITWFKENWQWFFVIILIPLIKWLYGEWKKNRDKKEE
jgi:hypothetical protein